MAPTGIIHLLKSNPIALTVSVSLHLILIIIFGVNLTTNIEVPKQTIVKKDTVKAVVVDEKAVEREIQQIKKAEQQKKKKIQSEAARLKKKLADEKKRLDKIKKEQLALKKKNEQQKKKIAQEKLAAQKKIEAEKKAALEKIEADKLAAEAKLKAEADARKKKEAEIAANQRRLKAEQELKLKLAEEERRHAAQNKELANLRAQYVRLIEQKVERNWLRPTAIKPGSECEVFVTQSILGDVINVRLGSCTDNLVFRNSIERAVRKSSPLPPPPNPDVFDREIRFIFKPKE